MITKIVKTHSSQSFRNDIEQLINRAESEIAKIEDEDLKVKEEN